ncbi:hypothetical protein Val02_88180 [Virgisporangium aliadipatigenens]|uniref:Secreted protein n=1 Tax=Virgisporangium aliadipatigenens TaxID=741659 RepID=A0A8J3YWF0_9ACTN|nr:hypothetical protein [Virgisporangium aliadipatigenens]GIJ51932.1 hypothetical protein Val02_88180 [Virgisporangium aliadipatigenens]
MIARRVLRTLAATAVVVATFGCANIWGANPADGACGYRPEGLVDSDVVGTWQSPAGTRLLLNADGTFIYEPGASGGSGGASPSAARSPVASPSRPGFGLPRPSPTATEGSAAGRPQGSARPSPGGSRSSGAGVESGTWTLLPKTDSGDFESDPPTLKWLYVTGTREAPWLYRFGDADPDACVLVRYDRVPN